MKILLKEINFPEGPAIDNTGKIWLVEKESGNLISIDNQQVERYKVGGHPNGIAIDKSNLIWFCDSLQNSIRTYNSLTCKTTTIISTINGIQLKMPNDLAFDQNDNLLFTCPGDSLTDNTGYICCLNTENEVSIVKQSMLYPNGLAFSNNYKNLYVAETGTHNIWQFDWDLKTKTLSNESILCNTEGPIGPDGIALDEDGNLYVAVYGSSFIKIFNPNGQLLEKIPLPGKNPTNCALDPNGKLGLIITEAEKGNLIQVRINKKGIL